MKRKAPEKRLKVPLQPPLQMQYTTPAENASGIYLSFQRRSKMPETSFSIFDFGKYGRLQRLALMDRHLQLQIRILNMQQTKKQQNRITQQ
jgi:hypothetical protein